MKKGDLAGGEALYLEALEAARAIDEMHVASALNNLATVCTKQGKCEAGLPPAHGGVGVGPWSRRPSGFCQQHRATGLGATAQDVTRTKTRLVSVTTRSIPV